MAVPRVKLYALLFCVASIVISLKTQQGGEMAVEETPSEAEV